MSELKDLKTAEYQDLVNQGGVTVVDFWAPWCGYCVKMAPIYDRVAELLGDQLETYKVNTDEEMDLARKYNIQVLPTFAVFKNGEIVDQFVGDKTLNETKEFFEAHLG